MSLFFSFSISQSHVARSFLSTRYTQQTTNASRREYEHKDEHSITRSLDYVRSRFGLQACSHSVSFVNWLCFLDIVLSKTSTRTLSPLAVKPFFIQFSLASQSEEGEKRRRGRESVENEEDEDDDERKTLKSETK